MTRRSNDCKSGVNLILANCFNSFDSTTRCYKSTLTCKLILISIISKLSNILFFFWVKYRFSYLYCIFKSPKYVFNCVQEVNQILQPFPEMSSLRRFTMLPSLTLSRPYPPQDYNGRRHLIDHDGIRQCDTCVDIPPSHICHFSFHPPSPPATHTVRAMPMSSYSASCSPSIRQCGARVRRRRLGVRIATFRYLR